MCVDGGGMVCHGKRGTSLYNLRSSDLPRVPFRVSLDLIWPSGYDRVARVARYPLGQSKFARVLMILHNKLVV
jgi:hypothetical protein